MASSSVSDGTYVILNVQNPNLALDSANATDRSGANVQVCTRNDSDAQYVTVVSDSRFYDQQMLFFPATGKLVDVTNAVLAQGQNVMQCDYNGGWNQKFIIQPVGNPITPNGFSNAYQPYKIRTTQGNYVLEVEGPAASITSGSNVCIAQDNENENDRLWVFLAKNPRPDGTYEMVPVEAPEKRVGVSGGSKGDGARVILQDKNGESYQKVYLQTDMGQTKLVFTHDAKLMETLNTNAAAVGDVVCQCKNQDQSDQKWLLQPDGSATIGSTTYPAYCVSNVASEGATLVITHDGTGAGTGLTLQEKRSNRASQRFVFIPSSPLDSSLPTPSNVGFMVNGSVVKSGSAKYAKPKLYFECVGDAFLARYRTRVGKLSSSGVTWGSWSAWKSTFDGSTSNEGWGTAKKANANFNASTTAKSVGPLTIPSLTTAEPLVQIQGEVRAFNNIGGMPVPGCAHGNKGASGTVTLTRQPTLTLAAPKLTKDGIELSYTSDWNAGGCTLAVSKLTVGTSTFVSSARRTTGLNGKSGKVTIGWASMLAFPQVGQSAKVTAKLETGYLPSATISRVANLATKGTVRAINPTYAETPYGSYRLTPDSGSTARVFLRYDGKVTEYKQKSGKVEIFPPLGKSCKVTVVEVANNGAWWGYREMTLPAIKAHAYLWTFGDGDYAVLDLGVDGPPKQASKRTRNYESYVTTSRQYPATRFLTGGTRDMTCTGVVVEGMSDHGTKEAFVRLLQAGHATFRNMRGEVVTVAVTGIEDSIERMGRTEITVEQHQETR